MIVVICKNSKLLDFSHQTVKSECAQINFIDCFRSADQDEHGGTYELIDHPTQVSIKLLSIYYCNASLFYY